MEYVFTRYNNINTGILFDDKKPVQIDCFEEESCIGNIYIGKISNIVKNINAVFVDISRDESCYFSLEDYKMGVPLKTGDRLLVQVTKDKIKTKQATVSTNLSLTGTYIVVSLNGVVGVSNKIKDEGKRKELSQLFKQTREELSIKHPEFMNYGAVIRTQAETASDEEIKEETIKLLCKLRDIIEKSRCLSNYTCLYKAPSGYCEAIAKMYNKNIPIVTDLPEIVDTCRDMGHEPPKLYTDEYELYKKYGLTDVIRKANSKTAYLKCGGYLVIEPTEAMTVIDVNSGKAIKGSADSGQKLAINKEAAFEIARQIRLRNLSGMIIIDFISMKSEIDQRELINTLKSAVCEDPVECNVVDITRLGLVEMTRKKVRKPIYEIFA